MASPKCIKARYGQINVKPATATHAGKLQHLLRLTDLRECMIQGSTPWRALHLPLTIDDAETFTALVGKTLSAWAVYCHSMMQKIALGLSGCLAHH